MNTIICSKCGNEVEHKAHGLCLKCYAAKYYVDNKEEILAGSHAYHKANPDRLVNNHLIHKFGITFEEYTEILDSQNGVCAICGMTPEKNGRRLCVDHSHNDLNIRGLLCTNCNYGIGRMMDSPELLRRAIEYLEGDK